MIDALAISRVVLVPDRRPASSSRSPVTRRYRLARLQLNHRERAGGDRFGRLKRVHD